MNLIRKENLELVDPSVDPRRPRNPRLSRFVEEVLADVERRSAGEDNYVVDGNPPFRLGCQPGAAMEAGNCVRFAGAG